MICTEPFPVHFTELVKDTNFLPFSLSFTPCPFSIYGYHVDPAKDITQRISQTQDSPVNQSSLPAARQAWGREQCWHQPCSVGWNRS